MQPVGRSLSVQRDAQPARIDPFALATRMSTDQGEAQTILENCGNTLILRCSASEQGGTARFASRLIGEREIVRVHESRSRHAGSWESSKTTSEHHVTEAAVRPSEIEQLPDLSGYLKLASSPSWQKVQIQVPRR